MMSSSNFVMIPGVPPHNGEYLVPGSVEPVGPPQAEVGVTDRVYNSIVSPIAEHPVQSLTVVAGLALAAYVVNRFKAAPHPWSEYLEDK